MKTDYEERRERRLENAKAQAIKNEEAQGEFFKRSDQLANAIPFGQPILIGHHSEKRHRAHIEKIHNLMGKGVEAGQKAKYYEGKAEAIENNTAISSDDPQALEKLKAKLEKLEQWQESMKAVNKILKKGTDAERVEKLVQIGVPETTAIKLLVPDQFGRLGFPSYKLTNNNGNMGRIRERIKHLERVTSMESKEEEFNGIRIVSNVEGNRLQIFFPGKPEEKVREELKRSGFHWSPQEGAWQRFLSPQAEYHAKRIITCLP